MNPNTSPLVRFIEEKIWTKPDLAGNNEGSGHKNAASVYIFSAKL